MKKILFSFLAFLVLSLGFSLNLVSADSTTDIFNEESTLENGVTYDFALLENSSYSFEVTFTEGQWAQEQANFIWEFALNDSIFSEGEVTAFEDLIGTIYTGTFDTGAGNTTLQIWFYDYTNNVFENYMLSDLDIKLYWLGNTAAPDTVDPEFSYSNLSVNSPYYDLVTAAEIQSQLHATDDEDGDVTANIEVYEDTYTPATKVVGGDYYIMYRVADTAGNYAYLRVDIEVIDDVKPYIITVDGEVFDEYGNPGSYTVTNTYYDGHVFNYSWYYGQPIGDYEDFYMSYWYADEYYGILEFPESAHTTLKQDPASIPVGVHSFTTSISDPSGNTATYTFNLTVLENQAPVITGSSEITVEATTFNLASIVAAYSATDTEDGTATVTASPVDSATYSNAWATNHTVGDYTLYLSAVDSMSLETIKEVTVHVVDTTIPEIKVDGIAVTSYDLTVNMSDTSTYQTFISTITATDAYYGNITADLVFPTEPSFTLPGTTQKTVTVTDASGNVGSLVINVTVVDDIAPVINGAVKVVKGKTATLTLSEITAQISAIDNVDGTLTVEMVQDAYTGNATVVGSYLVKYKATDSSGNISYHDVRVWVVDNVAPVWVVDDFFINLGLNETMTRTELVALLQASGMLANDISYTVTFLSDDYTGNEEVEGAYSVVMRITYENGAEDEITVQLNVPADADAGDLIVVTPEESLTGLQKTILWLKNAGQTIWNGIKAIGKAIWSFLQWIYYHILEPAWEFVFKKDVTDVPDTIGSIYYKFYFAS